jgi:hypothetical protein
MMTESDALICACELAATVLKNMADDNPAELENRRDAHQLAAILKIFSDEFEQEALLLRGFATLKAKTTEAKTTEAETTLYPMH